jgi:glutathione peroxidase
MSIYDISIKSAEGEENFLDQFKGKVCLITNTTGDCGNAPQYGVLETIYRKYKDKGFEIIAVPTNDYCGVGLTNGDHVYGTEDGLATKQWSEDTFNTTYPFTEMVESNPSPLELIPGLESKYGKVESHKLFTELTKNGSKMGGNFEKYLVGKDGKLIKHYGNHMLLDYNYEKNKDNPEGTHFVSGEVAYTQICKDIEEALTA